MKQWMCIIWMVLIAWQMGYQGIVYAYYSLQKEQITKVHCENKNKPTLKCDGKCYLKIMLAASEDPSTSSAKDAPIVPKEIPLKPLVALLQPITNFSAPSFRSSSLEWCAPINRDNQSLYKRLLVFDLLDPPQQAV